MDARKEGAAVIAIAGDVETSLIDTEALEELNPYKFFAAPSLYTGWLVNPEQARAIINTAILHGRPGRSVDPGGTKDSGGSDHPQQRLP
jgi:thiamine pyrophosphate-dependent acetolactate synthase large subunit-like protein